MSTVCDILQLGNPILRLRADIVNNLIDMETQHIIDRMKKTLASTQGVGLAAPQIGISKRVVIVASRPTPRYPNAPTMNPVVMINPSFQALSEAKEKDWEGCLSIPGIRALVPRHTEIQVLYTDERGQCAETRLEGFVARIFQHEYDHLDGFVYLDRVDNNRDIFSESEYLKIIG